MPVTKTVIFLHIHKAGGNTLRFIIERSYSRETVFHYYKSKKERRQEFEHLTEIQKQRLKLIVGHVEFGWHRLLPQASTYVTMLREPVDRVISNYYWTRSNPHHYFHQNVVEPQLNLQEYLTSGIDWVVDNGQTRMLSGIGENIPFGECNKEMLEQAKANLQDHCAVVGLLESFDESILLMQQAFGWRIPFYLNRNVTVKRLKKAEVLPETRSLISEINSFDIELYQYAQSLFNDAIAQQGLDFKRKVSVFRLLNKLYINTYPAARFIYHQFTS